VNRRHNWVFYEGASSSHRSLTLTTIPAACGRVGSVWSSYRSCGGRFAIGNFKSAALDNGRWLALAGFREDRLDGVFADGMPWNYQIFAGAGQLQNANC
jgi:hypothetical protein